MTLPSNLEFMDRQVVTLFRHTHAGRLLSVNEPDAPLAPRCFLGLTTEGNLWRFRHDLPGRLVDELTAILAVEPPLTDARQAPVTLARLRAVLAEHAPIEQTWHGPAWSFPAGFAPPNAAKVDIDLVHVTDPALVMDTFPWLAASLAIEQPCVAVIEHGVAVAICRSARTSAVAAEAGVETLPAYRRRGYAAAVVAGWARAVRQTGREPLYSTAWDNRASQAVARRLGLLLYGVDLHIT